MAVITIPSSFSPIAAAIDVFTQDRLAQQKRARQAEQDAWNLEARDRQRENWGYVDQEREYQQQQRAKLAQAQAEKDAKALTEETRVQGLADTWAPSDARIAYTGIRPETGYGTGLDELAGAGEDERTATFMEHQDSLAKTLARFKGAPKPGVTAYNAVLGMDDTGPTSEVIAAAWDVVERYGKDPTITKQQYIEAAQMIQGEKLLTTLRAASKSRAGDGASTQGPLDTTELKRLMDIAANRAVSVGQGGVLGAGATGFGTGDDEFAGTGPSPALFSPEDQGRALSRAHEMLEGRTGQSYSDYENIWAPPKEETPDPVVRSSIGESGMTQKQIGSAYGRVFDPQGEELSKIANVLRAGLQQHGGAHNVIGAGDLPIDASAVSSVDPAMQDMIMRNMWQAAQILHSQNPTTSARAIFESLMENIGSGDTGLDILGIDPSMVAPARDDFFTPDEPATYRAGIGQEGGPRLKSPQDIAADYQALLEFAQRHQ